MSIVYTASRWQVDLRRRELRADGIPVPVGPRAFEIVEVLVRSAGKLVTKDELMRAVWPGALVEEATLWVHLSAIRKALGADRAMLKTMSRQGYCLMGNWIATDQDLPPNHSTPLASDMPAWRVISNIPEPTQDLIGRETAIQKLVDLSSAYRVVTLTGPGGIGKTVLALEVVRRLLPGFGGKAGFVDLSSLSDPDLVPSAVATAIGLRVGGDSITAEAIGRAIGRNKLLLVLDNCEHVIDAASTLAEAIIRTCPRVSVLATSRELLRIAGEHVFRVPPLEAPLRGNEDAEAVLKYSAVQLFIARTKALSLDFAPGAADLSLIASICQRLDGIPLAIEFASACAAAIGLQEVVARLADRFGLLTDGPRTAPPRHRTLGATLEWSYHLLPASEQCLLRHLAVFPGGFTMDAAISVAGENAATSADVVRSIRSLVSKSLVATEGSPVARWKLLETTRAYVREKLAASGELTLFARRHAEYHVALFKQAGTEYVNLSPAEWLDRYGRQVDDVRAALDWAFGPDGDPSTGVALTVAAAPLWVQFSLLGESAKHTERAISWLLTDPDHDMRQEMRLYAAQATALLFTRGRIPEVHAAWSRVLEIARGQSDSVYQFQALEGLWVLALNSSQFQEALSIARDTHSAAVEAADVPAQRRADRMIGAVLHHLGDQVGARQHLESALNRDSSGAQQPPMWGSFVDPAVSARTALARTLWVQGFPDQAWQVAEEGVAGARRSGSAILLCFALIWGTIPVARLNGDLPAAEEAVATLLEVSEGHGIGFRAWCRCAAAMLQVKRGDIVAGVSALRAALAEVRERRLALGYPARVGDLAEALGLAGNVEEGLLTIDEALRFAASNNEYWCTAELLRIKAELMLMKDDDEAVRTAETLFAESLNWARRQVALSWELRTSLGMGRLLHRQGRPDEAYRLLAPVYQRFSEGFATADLVTARTFLDDVMIAGGSGSPMR